MSKTKPNNELLNPTKDVSIEDYMAAKAELDALRAERGLPPVEQEGPISRLITKYFAHREAREKPLVSKKKLLWMTLLLGWCGGHRFYTKRYVLGGLYLAFCWAGVPTAMAVIDLMEIIPLKADENGMVRY